MKNFFTIFFILYQKIPLVSSLKNSPYFIFFPKDDWATIIFNFLLLRPCTLFVLQTSQSCFWFFIRLVSSFQIWHRQYPTASSTGHKSLQYLLHNDDFINSFWNLLTFKGLLTNHVSRVDFECREKQSCEKQELCNIAHWFICDLLQNTLKL